MSNKEKRLAEYLAKTLSAKTAAAKSKTPEDREKWDRITEAYLGLAQSALGNVKLQLDLTQGTVGGASSQQ